MPGILRSYVFRELAVSWATIAFVLLTVLLLSQVPRALERAMANQIAPEVVWKTIGWLTISGWPNLLPFTLLLAIVVTFGRLQADHEMTAIRSGGITPLQLLVPVLALAVPLFLLQTGTTLKFAPDAVCNALKSRTEVVRNLAMAPPRPGVFQAIGRDAVFYVAAVDPDGTLRDVFIRREDGGRTSVTTARSGRITVDAANDRVVVTLSDGEQHEGRPGEAAFRIVRFAEQSLPLGLPAGGGRCERVDARPTAELLATRTPAALAELSQRLALPFMVIAVVLIALPLAESRPRSGRFARLGPAIVFYFVYANATVALSPWIARQPGAGLAGYWAIQFAVLGVGLFWFWRLQTRGHR